MKFYSPLRYPGGKGKLMSYFKELLKENSLRGCLYVEPYVGGASVALSLLIDGYASRIIINDKDRAVYAFWHSVLNYNEELCKLIKETPVTIKIWEKQKKLQKTKETADLLRLGFSTFFLNRTNRSGILNAGAIGGKSQKGKWKIDARFNKEDLIERIKLIASYKSQIDLFNMDAVDLIKFLKNQLPSKTLIYLDPPYYRKGKELYMNYYRDEDHVKIANEINRTKKQKWVITYDAAPLIEELYQNNQKTDYVLSYSAGKSKRGKELMIFSDNLKLKKPLKV